MNELEVLSPAGDEERFAAALNYGADAVYLGRKQFGMRASPLNFEFEQLCKAVEAAHSKGVKVYLTCNTLPRNSEIPFFERFVKEAVDAKVDALIVADIGLLMLIKKYAPDMEIHISTQTGIVNYVTARELYNMGAKRVVLARELSLDEIAEIRAKTSPDLDIETFVHGAMCVSFSGRCLLSQYLVNRDANRGECAQPCRWGYHLMEEKRPGEFFPVYEDEKGTYILNSKDMCMIEHIDKLAQVGVKSLKIEGRAKSAYYVAVVTNAYRMAVDHYYKDPDNFTLPEWIRDEVYKVSHRKYCNGFFFGTPEESQYYENSGYIRNYDVVAVVEKCENGTVYCTQRNRFFAGDTVELLAPSQKPVEMKLDKLYDENGEEIETANHAMMKFSFKSDIVFPNGTVIRKETT
ncbi:putative protease [Ruminococcus flavefaciens]|uniref:Putative protease n=1 Tax=Ruminococcus flavefaciens TaxID=1265 RepID=A0A1H6HSY6_RUMFL|nr:U32 family peptidase [Ruminococcus flavefaciens]SEH37103.1 putative protease [Ruminococcus flavefaciens]